MVQSYFDLFQIQFTYQIRDAALRLYFFNPPHNDLYLASGEYCKTNKSVITKHVVRDFEYFLLAVNTFFRYIEEQD